MDRRGFLGLSAVAALPRRAWAGAGAGRRDRADLILHNGAVHTLQNGFPVVSAIAITGDRVTAVGDDTTVRQFADRKTETIDLQGKTVIPGINDSHLHAAVWGLSQPPFSIDVGPPAVASIAGVAEVVAKAVRERKSGEWITGRGWDQPYFAEGRAPTRADLDKVSPDHPVILTEFSGHAIWVNSKALALAGIDRTTVPPQGGVVVKDAAGEPTGVLFEGAAGLVRRIVPPATPADRDRAIGTAIDWMLARGITSFTEPGIDASTLELYAARARAGKLGARLTALIAGGRSLATARTAIGSSRAPEGVDAKWLRVTGIKLFADGIPTNNKTAWLHQPYVGGGTGKLVVDGATDEERVRELHGMIRAAHEAGLQVGTHATGDRAIDTTVDGYIAAIETSPRKDARHYVIHADLTMPATLARMAKNGIGANFNANIKYLIADGQVGSIGVERATYEWPYRTALDAGVHVATGSDAPVTDGDWRQGLATCVLRKGNQSKAVSGPEQRITLNEALASYTTTGAWQDFAESWKGSLESGKVADLVVLDGPLAQLPAEDYPKLAVTMTIVGGRIAFSAS
jgi:predicted amidohydrolase YtcJ